MSEVPLYGRNDTEFIETFGADPGLVHRNPDFRSDPSFRLPATLCVPVTLGGDTTPCRMTGVTSHRVTRHTAVLPVRPLLPCARYMGTSLTRKHPPLGPP